MLCEFIILPDTEKRRVKVVFVMECSSFDFFTSTHQKKPRVAFSLPVPTEMAILKGVVHVTDTPTSRG